MALETLKGIKSIGGFEIHRPETDSVCNPLGLITVYDSTNEIGFKIQDGSIAENGVNGCQVQTMIEAAKIIIEGLNAKFPCRDNSMVITKLDEAIMWSKKRTEDRIARNVEGFNKA